MVCVGFAFGLLIPTEVLKGNSAGENVLESSYLYMAMTVKPCVLIALVLLQNVCARCRTLSRRGHFVLTHAWADSGAVLLLCSPGRHVFQADNFNDYGESCSLRCGSSKCVCSCELKVFKVF